MKRYITASIPYANAVPHIGHSYEMVAADAAARYYRLRGDDVRFCMGLDENSQHVVAAARAAGVSPGEWVDRMDDGFRLAWRALTISNDVWIRTTNPVHVRTAQELFRRAQAAGDIYRGAYAGWYCPNCNNYYSDEDLVDGHCPEHPSLRPEWLEEENYFFALTRYSRQLSDLVDSGDDFVVPAAWRSEVVAMLRRGLRDFSVSRRVRDVPWGIPVPGDPEQVIYVWFDALSNYVTGAGFPDDAESFRRYWPADFHVIGKNITRFHCLYWPAMLLSAGLDLPRQIAVHGFMTLEGEKISKTTGNLIDPVGVVDEFGTDAVRYYLLREFSFGADGDFSRSRLLHRYNADLANDLGNLLNRTTVMALRYLGGELPAPSVEMPVDREIAEVANGLSGRVEAAVGAWDFPAALEAVWTLVRRANVYVEECEPWRLARAADGSVERARLGVVLANLAEALRIIAIHLAPFVPETADRIAGQLGRPAVGAGALAHAGWNQGGEAPRIVGGTILFPRRD